MSNLNIRVSPYVATPTTRLNDPQPLLLWTLQVDVGSSSCQLLIPSPSHRGFPISQPACLESWPYVHEFACPVYQIGTKCLEPSLILENSNLIEERKAIRMGQLERGVKSHLRDPVRVWYELSRQAEETSSEATCTWLLHQVHTARC